MPHAYPTLALKHCYILSTLSHRKTSRITAIEAMQGDMMQRLRLYLLISGCACLLVLSGCGQQQDSPTAAVQAYLNARVAADGSKIAALTCKDQEGLAEAEAASFKSLNAKLDSVSCSKTSTDGDYTIVACTGNILTTYNGETTPRPLAGKNFKTIQEDGQWKVCGYQ